MSKGKKNEPFDPHNLKPEEILKFEIATELGLSDKAVSYTHLTLPTNREV